MINQEVALVGLMYMLVFVSGMHVGRTDRPNEMEVTRFLGNWIAVSIIMWGGQWLLAKYVIGHMPLRVVPESLFMGFINALVVVVMRLWDKHTSTRTQPS